MTDLTLNTALLRRVADLIELEGRFDLAFWGRFQPRTERDTDYISPSLLPTPAELLENGASDGLPPCDTVGCVAGWVNASLGTQDLSDWPVAAVALGARAELANALSGGTCFVLRDDHRDLHRFHTRLFTAGEGSIWAGLAPDFGWELEYATDALGNEVELGLASWSDITAVQAAKVLRMLANGEVTL